MTTDVLAELIADAEQIVLPKPRTGPPRPAHPRDADAPTTITIPDAAATLADGFDDYGA